MIRIIPYHSTTTGMSRHIVERELQNLSKWHGGIERGAWGAE
jgi:hypothetical protein